MHDYKLVSAKLKLLFKTPNSCIRMKTEKIETRGNRRNRRIEKLSKQDSSNKWEMPEEAAVEKKSSKFLSTYVIFLCQQVITKNLFNLIKISLSKLVF